MRKETREAFLNILDCFCGNDGGASFAKLQSLIKGLDAKAEIGDPAAQHVVDLVFQFSRLVNIAKIPPPKPGTKETTA